VRRVEGEELRGREGKEAARRTGKGEVAATGPGEDTTGQNVCSISRAATPSSLGDDGRDSRVHRARTTPQTLDATHRTVSGTAADTATPNVKSAGSPEPVGASHTPQGEPREMAGSGVRGRIQVAKEKLRLKLRRVKG
jgi:hypothetical protein